MVAALLRTDSLRLLAGSGLFGTSRGLLEADVAIANAAAALDVELLIKKSINVRIKLVHTPDCY